MHAFIIEDDYLIGQSLRDMLEGLGFTRVSFARSEDAAVLGASDQQIDVITAISGCSRVMGSVRSRKSGVAGTFPSPFITGYADELKERAADAIVLQKPVDREALAGAVGEVFLKYGQRC